jgi:protein-S-isoprenylcysteine O-methyltransferase Ste14
MPPASPAPESAARAALRTALASIAWAAVHSALATHAAKRRAERLAGARAARGFYRLAYNAQAVATTAALGAYVWRHRGPVVFEARGAARPLVVGAQVAAAALFLRALYDGGIGDLSGARPVAEWARGGPQRPIPDGQGPLESDAGGPAPRGLSFHTRNPSNVFIVPLLWIAPRVRAGWAGMAAALTGYAVAGSWHTERMLVERWGAPYEAYRRSGVPFYVPRLRAADGPAARGQVAHAAG